MITEMARRARSRCISVQVTCMDQSAASRPRRSSQISLQALWFSRPDCPADGSVFTTFLRHMFTCALASQMLADLHRVSESLVDGLQRSCESWLLFPILRAAEGGWGGVRCVQGGCSVLTGWCALCSRQVFSVDREEQMFCLCCWVFRKLEMKNETQGRGERVLLKLVTYIQYLG